MVIRPFEDADIDKGLLKVLSNLSKIREVSPLVLEQILRAWKNEDAYHVLVAEIDGQIVGTATLITTWKLTRGGVRAGRIADVVVAKDHQDSGIGTKLVERLIEVTRELGCYMIKLNCQSRNVSWYERFSFSEHGVAMRLDF